ncbi:DgyrCDS9204 [Dimorphilus gyrociliatus]|nr:DgyrCDS9204 [Dimorphilus gyrociliatus]
MFLSIVVSACEMYYFAVITTVEKALGLSSKQSALLISLKETVYLVGTLLLSDILSKIHRPRTLAGLIAVIGFGSLLTSLSPMFADKAGVEIVNHTGNLHNNSNQTNFCNPQSDSLYCQNEVMNPTGKFNIGAYIVLFLGLCLVSIVLGPFHPISTAFIHDSTSNKAAPVYLGIFNAALPIGPVLSLSLSAYILSTFRIDLSLAEPGDVDRSDWIGAWWFGYALFAPICIIIPIFMCFCPRSFKKLERENDDKNDDKKSVKFSRKAYLKNVLRRCLKLLINPIYICLTTSVIFHLIFVAGILPFIPKYFETQYFFSTSQANLVTGIFAVGAALGMVMGGAMQTLFKLKPRGQLALCVISNITVFTTQFIVLFISCNDEKVRMDTNVVDYESIANKSCLEYCNCDKYLYEPVCSSDGSTYFSSCYAGCSTFNETTKEYGNCICLEDTLKVATLGACNVDCSIRVWGVILFIISSVVGFMCEIPALTLWFSYIEAEDKTLGIALASVLSSFLAFMPSPLIYGNAFDKSCSMWKENCQLERENCLIYDRSAVRHNIVTLNIIFTALSFIILLPCIYFIRKYPTKDGEAKETNVHAEDVNMSLTGAS